MSSSDTSRRSRAPHLTKRVGKYYVGRTIGEGTYAKVKYGQQLDTAEAVAIKVLNKDHLVRAGMVEQIKREITVLKKLRHPHIVNLKEVMSSNEKIFMVMELVTGGDLFDKIAAEGPMKEPEAKILFLELLSALDYCHKRGIYHRDIKPENVLLTSDGHAKLSDFGLGVIRQRDPASAANDILTTICGTPNYAAPEVLAKKGYSGSPADVWSLGVVLYVVLAGCLPFDEDHLAVLLEKISNAEYVTPPWISSEAADLLQRMLTADPAQRCSLASLYDYPWLAGVPQSPMLSVGGQKELARASNSATMTMTTDDEEDTAAFGPGVERESISSRESLALASGLSPTRHLNAFQLINDYLDISAMFEARDDLVTRHTRFTSSAAPEDALAAIEAAAVAVGGRVEKRTDKYVRVYMPTRKGPIRVTTNVLEFLPGKRLVDLCKVSGDSIEFYKWYADLASALDGMVVGDKKIFSGPRESSQRRLRRRLNAFDLIGCNLNIAAMFDLDEDDSSGHVQFSSRSAPGDIVQAFEESVVALGGRIMERSGLKSITRAEVPSGGGQTMRIRIRMFELLPRIQVVQIVKDRGSLLDLYKIYNRLAGGPLGDIMMRRRDGRTAHPRASHAPSLASSSALSSLGLTSDTGPGSLRQTNVSLQSSFASDGGARSVRLRSLSGELSRVLEGDPSSRVADAERY